LLEVVELKGFSINTARLNSYENSDKPRKTEAAQCRRRGPRLPGHLRERLRCLHYSTRTEQTYVY